MTHIQNCNPFIKWVGGKKRLVNEICKYIPDSYNKYFEPFLGGGALFFTVQPADAFISDVNRELIDTYITIRDNVNELISALDKHENNQEYFYNIRNIDRDKDVFNSLSKIERASRFIYLNKACFNGMYRVNITHGYFNVPYGRPSKLKLYDTNNLYACSAALQHCNIECRSFEMIENIVSKNDFVYFDPPYAEMFQGYTIDKFEDDLQIRLRKLCDVLTSKGVHLILSNSDVDFIYNQYKDYNIHKVEINRLIGGKGSKRKKINELIITNC